MQYVIDVNNNYNIDNFITTFIGSHEKAAKKWLSVKIMVAFKA